MNGTSLNGQSADDNPLRDQDEIVIGDNVFIYEGADVGVPETR